MTKKGRPWHSFKDELIDFSQTFALSDRFGWTPEQIITMDEEDKMKYISMLHGISLGEKEVRNK